MTTHATALREFERRCRTASDTPTDVVLFQQIVGDAPEALKMSQRALAVLLEVSPASVTRYAQGKNAPHPTMRRLMLDSLADAARQQVRELQRQEGAEQQARSRAQNAARSRVTPAWAPSMPPQMAASGRDNR